jgi:hypothetical protein
MAGRFVQMPAAKPRWWKVAAPNTPNERGDMSPSTSKWKHPSSRLLSFPPLSLFLASSIFERRATMNIRKYLQPAAVATAPAVKHTANVTNAFGSRVALPDDEYDKLTPNTPQALQASEAVQCFANLTFDQLHDVNTCPDFLKTALYVGAASLREHILNTDVVFLLGLLERLISGDKPSAADLFTTSLPLKRGYGVYVIAMIKTEEDEANKEEQVTKYRLYGGSNVNATNGITAHMKNYDNLEPLPVGVERSLAGGYDITNKCIVAWSRLPKITKYTVAVLFKVLESSINAFFGLHHAEDEEGFARCL